MPEGRRKARCAPQRELLEGHWESPGGLQLRSTSESPGAWRPRGTGPIPARPKFLIQALCSGPENLHFDKFPGAANLETTHFQNYRAAPTKITCDTYDRGDRCSEGREEGPFSVFHVKAAEESAGKVPLHLKFPRKFLAFRP